MTANHTVGLEETKRAGIRSISAPIDIGRSRSRAGARFELIESKLRPPQTRGGVARAKVISALERSRSMPVVVVSAGPGWGKTTLLAQWAARSDRRFAWVEIDEHDNDPIVLLTYVAAALDRIEALDPKVFDALSSRGVVAGDHGGAAPRCCAVTNDPAGRPGPGRTAAPRQRRDASMRWPPSRGTCPTSRSWSCRRVAFPRFRSRRCAPGAWRSRWASTTCAWIASRRTSCCAKRGSTCETTTSTS